MQYKNRWIKPHTKFFLIKITFCSIKISALLPENVDRNRFKDVVPYDENRVRIMPDKVRKKIKIQMNFFSPQIFFSYTLKFFFFFYRRISLATWTPATYQPLLGPISDSTSPHRHDQCISTFCNVLIQKKKKTLWPRENTVSFMDLHRKLSLKYIRPGRKSGI